MQEEDVKWTKPAALKIEQLIRSEPTLILFDAIPVCVAAPEPSGEGEVNDLPSISLTDADPGRLELSYLE